jgi:hypothetical protein
LVLDSPGDRDPGLGRVWDFSQQAKDAESARLAVCVEDTADPSTAPDKTEWMGWVRNNPTQANRRRRLEWPRSSLR